MTDCKHDRLEKAEARIAELEHAIVGIRGIVENWREAVHSDYGAMAAVEDHMSRVPSVSVAKEGDSSEEHF